jgi:hypothetical protein
MDLYAGDFWMFDNAGTQNNYVQLAKGDGNATYDFWWTPPPVMTARWNDTTTGTLAKPLSGPYNTANANDKDAVFEFRIVNSNHSRPDLNPGAAQGTMCLKSFSVDGYDLTNNLTVDPTGPVWQTAPADWVLAQGTTVNPNSMHMDNNTNVNVTFTANTGVTLKVASGNGISGSSGDCFAQIAPGDNVGLATGDILTESNIVDNYPGPMDPLSLYKVTYMLHAPTQSDEDHPIDVLFFGAECFNDQAIVSNYVDTHAWHCAMPAFKVPGKPDGTPQPYVSFFYTNYGMDPANPSYWGWKPTMAISNNSQFISSASNETKVGGIMLTSIKIEKIVGGMN